MQKSGGGKSNWASLKGMGFSRTFKKVKRSWARDRARESKARMDRAFRELDALEDQMNHAGERY